MPWKLPSWKALIGVLSLIGGIATALTVSNGTLPKSFDAVLAIVGAVLLAVERWAEAQDYATDNPATPATNAPQPPPVAVPEI